VAPLAWRATTRNAINDHCEFEIGLKRTIEPKREGKPLSSIMALPPCTTHPLLHANRAQPIAVSSEGPPDRFLILIPCTFNADAASQVLKMLKVFFNNVGTTNNQQNKFALAINTCWQNFFCDMCVAPGENLFC
jgi:hypothetical protein